MAWFGGFTLETYNRIPGDYEMITVGTQVASLSDSKIAPFSGCYARMQARAALLTSEEGDLRFRIDGGQPSATSGHYLTSGDTLVLTGTQALKQFLAVRVGDTNSTLRLTYFY
jgi:hypothetical protein